MADAVIVTATQLGRHFPASAYRPLIAAASPSCRFLCGFFKLTQSFSRIAPSCPEGRQGYTNSDCFQYLRSHRLRTYFIENKSMDLTWHSLT